MQNSPNMTTAPLSLPKGGGAIQGMGEALNAAGPTGEASMTLPLPVSEGRGVAPGLSLSYSSSAGNGPFGMGWFCQPPTISLRTSHGTPRYDDSDSFLDPSGEVMHVAADEQGNPACSISNKLCGVTLSGDYAVSRYQPRIVHDFSRIERWAPQDEISSAFWVMFSTNGQVHVFGKNSHARMADPHNAQHVAQWLLEETVTPTGEHIYYHYRAEDGAGCDAKEIAQHGEAGASRYLSHICYGNIKPDTRPLSLGDALPEESMWLFQLLFDYGERSTSIYRRPDFYNADQWAVRPDCFSRFEYGFEVRTRRLCRQVLMFHRLETLQGNASGEDIPALVARLVLSYDLNDSISTLVSARQLAHEDDQTPVLLPPLEFDYQRPDLSQIPDWQPMPQLDGMNRFQSYQLIDLYGEGVPGVLYQGSPGAWYYRQPLRDENADGNNGVTYGAMATLPEIPSLQGDAALVDINGDGRLEWLITSAGIRGHHSLTQEGRWTPFIPLAALPTEFFHPDALLEDLTGDGLADLLLIGPKSVRLYRNSAQGWDKAVQVVQRDDLVLPLSNRDAAKLVAFSDLLGTGQQHLVEINSDNVKCWPNLGHGLFGAPLSLPGFSPATTHFNPEQVFLADFDGSGTTDILYAHSTFIELFINQCGNRFAAPVRIELPEGVKFDSTCQLQIADVQGLGTSGIILTVPHSSPGHWRLDLTREKPWLLKAMNNNMGANTSLFYRSSAQFWLDEKQRRLANGQAAVSYLPFPVHLLWRTELCDEITGNVLSSSFGYGHGAWDGREREFRGFGRVSQLDTDGQSVGTRRLTTVPLYPTRTVSWYSTGLPAIDARLPQEFWAGDEQAFVPFDSRFTQYDPAVGGDVAFSPSDENLYWLNRAFKGTPLRNEVYGEDGTPQALVPYSVTEHGAQVREIPSSSGFEPSAWVSEVETRSWNYERTSTDPQCSQQITLKIDDYGCVTDSVSIAYPRRPAPKVSPYPDTLPETLFASSYDPQQALLRLTRRQQRYHHLVQDDALYLGLPDVSRTDAWEYESTKIPDGGFNQEHFIGDFNLSGSITQQTLQGYERVIYQGNEGLPAFPPLVAFTESAAFDAASLAAFGSVFSEDSLADTLTAAGYVPATVPFSDDDEMTVWAARQGYTRYGDLTTFYRPQAERSTLLTGATNVTWDTHHCTPVATEDAAGLMCQVVIDYRFLSPRLLTDANDNQQFVTMNALGQVTSSRFWGTENGEVAGYSSPDTAAFIPPATVEDALALQSGIPVAECSVYDPHSWMPEWEGIGADAKCALNKSQLTEQGVLTEDNRICALALHRWLKNMPARASLFSGLIRTPVHAVTIITDRYDSDPAQQCRQSVAFSDGFGRQLQTAVRYGAGEAWQRKEDGALVVDEAGSPVSAYAQTRWAISGRTEFDGKGQGIRTYQPYFLDTWRYVTDDSARNDLYADTHYYDPLGRVTRIITAKGYRRESFTTPWFVVSEDENDTASAIG